MNAWLGVLVSASLFGTSILLLFRDPSKLSGKGASGGEVRDLAILVTVLGVLMAGITVYIFQRGTR